MNLISGWNCVDPWRFQDDTINIERFMFLIYYEFEKSNGEPKSFNKRHIFMKPSKIEAEASLDQLTIRNCFWN